MHSSSTVEEFAKMVGEEISPEAAEDIMTMAEQLINKGIEQGIEQGAIEIALRMIKEGSEPAFIMKVTQLPLAQLKNFKPIIKLANVLILSY